MTATTSPSAERPGFRIRGWHVFAMITAFFAVVIAVDGFFMALAFKTYPGEVSVTPYEDGLAYNRRIAQLRAQEQLGWREAAFVGSQGQLVADVRDAAGQPVRGLKATAQLQRPATQAGKITVALKETSPGRYEARPGAAPGAWDVTVVAFDAGGRRFEAERRLTWP